ncbi:hypothetical protein CXB51_032308 [Gossypium anomalum]|uniref:RNase H type-1 domain-containing protein n=1 Tax=Gossypium anomalum TaxID=47600 RepID=A0A8J5Y7V1_9ROSI|nr:hypothetical protein CXB51_032308 [Gossypium anomalum]
MGVGCLWNRYVPNALATKALASTQALRFARELRFWAVEVEGDSLVHIKRGGNQVAYLLAKERFWQKHDVWWMEDGPTVIQGLVRRDNLLFRSIEVHQYDDEGG